ncbi:MAG: phenylalanine--tRNA ligase subunit alpha [Candidatus Aenigmatarchaeota archaeon]|nr:MAG: phenylalanine--tRNA ligase subunit alpha [Candidatus Aenigmarchaeota archaeon]
MYRLTAEGKKYLDKGLPEINLVLYVREKGPTNIKHIQKELDEASVAVNWALRNKWIEMRGGDVHVVQTPQKYDVEDALKLVEKGRAPSDGLLPTLLKRRLVEEVRETLEHRAQKMVGSDIGTLTEDLIKTGAWKQVKLKPYNVEAVGKQIYPGKRQPYFAFLAQIKRKLVELGFKEYRGPSVELEFWNFDALYQPQGHPARDWTQTYSMKTPQGGRLPDRKVVNAVKAAHERGGDTGSTGWGYSWSEERAARLMPRAHDTAITPRLLVSGIEIPGKYFNISRCYRPDIIDATHAVEFDQMGGIVVDRNVTLRHLLGVLKEFATEVTGVKKVKFVPSYFPFTEPSVEAFGYHEELGWIEVGGAGIFRPELTQPLGIKEPVIAWGMGIGRLAMLTYGIKDIRYLFAQDLAWLRKTPVR